MSDITRLLFLLNKKPESVEMPPDGMQLLEWSEQTLHHYLESQVHPACTSAAVHVSQMTPLHYAQGAMEHAYYTHSTSMSVCMSP